MADIEILRLVEDLAPNLQPMSETPEQQFGEIEYIVALHGYGNLAEIPGLLQQEGIPGEDIPIASDTDTVVYVAEPICTGQNGHALEVFPYVEYASVSRDGRRRAEMSRKDREVRMVHEVDVGCERIPDQLGKVFPMAWGNERFSSCDVKRLEIL